MGARRRSRRDTKDDKILSATGGVATDPGAAIAAASGPRLHHPERCWQYDALLCGMALKEPLKSRAHSAVPLRRQNPCLCRRQL